MTSQEIASILAVLHGAYPNVKLDDAVAEVWANALSVSDFGAAREAVVEWVETQTRWPSIAEVSAAIRRRTVANQPQQIPSGNRVATVDEAKAAFSEGYRRHHRMKNPPTDEAIVEEQLAQYMRRFPGGILHGVKIGQDA